MPTVRVKCDDPSGCQAERQAKRGVTVDELRRSLVEVGWYCDTASNVDRCPLHADAYAERVL